MLNYVSLEFHKPDFIRCNYVIVNVHRANRTMIASSVDVKKAPYSFMTASAMKI